MKHPVSHRIGPVRGSLPAPCAAAALSSLTGRTVAECHRALARSHGRCPLDSAVTPAVLTSLEDLGFAHVLEHHEPPTTLVAWSAVATPGAYLIVVPGHMLAAELVHGHDGSVGMQVVDNGEFCTASPSPPVAPVLALPVPETIRCTPHPGGPGPTPYA